LVPLFQLPRRSYPEQWRVRQVDGASQWDAFLATCIPQEVQAPHQESKQNPPRRIPILYVPLRSFGCLRDPFPSGGYNNLLHFVHKLLHPTCRGQESCRSFTNCLRTVAKRENLVIRCLDQFAPSQVVLFPSAARRGRLPASVATQNMSRSASAVPLQIEGALHAQR
jgi:hypothetical protein